MTVSRVPNSIHHLTLLTVIAEIGGTTGFVTLETSERKEVAAVRSFAKLRVMTDTMLAERLIHDRAIPHASVVIIDEVHGRTPMVELIMGYMLEVSSPSMGDHEL